VLLSLDGGLETRAYTRELKSSHRYAVAPNLDKSVDRLSVESDIFEESIF
jgi:hypothetical protein